MEVASLSPLPVGVVFWNSPEPSLTVLTKMTLSFAAAGVALSPVQEPLRTALPSLLDCPFELHHPGDFVPRKARCDVLLTGCAYAGEPSAVIGANLQIGTLKKRFYALAAERSRAIPLSLAYLRDEPSSEAGEVTVAALSPQHPQRARFAATALDAAAWRREELSPDFDFAFFNAAPAEQQIAAISPGMGFALHGLLPGAAKVRGKLPTLWPRIYVADERRGHGLREIALVCDTLWIDTDRSLCELTFRGTLPLAQRERAPRRLIATLMEAFEKVDLTQIEAWASHAEIRRASELDDRGEVIEALGPAGKTLAAAEELAPEAGGGKASAAFVADDEVTNLHTNLHALRLAAEPTGLMELPRRSTTLAPPSDDERPRRSTTLAPPSDDERPRRSTTLAPPSDDERPRRPTTLAPPAGPEARPRRRPNTLPFERSSSSGPPPPRVAPPESGLPFLQPRGPRTLELAAEANPARAGLPFSGSQGRRPQTLELPPEENPVLAALAFADEDTDRPQTLNLPADRARALAAALPFPEALSARASSSDLDASSSSLEGLPFASTGAYAAAILPPPPPPASGLATAPSFGLPPAPVVAAAPGFAPAPAASPGFALPPAPVPSRDEQPPPWADADLGGTGARRRAPASIPGRPIETLGLFSLEKDAAIQLALWEGAAPLHEILARHGVDELKWREHRRLRGEELREEAAAGGSARAIAAHAAQEAAKRAGGEGFQPQLDVEAYARVRVLLQGTSDEPAVLAAQGIGLAGWERDHQHYRKRLRKDAALVERFERALAAEKTARGLPPPAAKKRARVAPKARRGASSRAALKA